MPGIPVPDGDLDVLTVGEALVDLIAEEDTERLRDAELFRRHLGGSPANIALYVAKLGGTAAVVAKTGIGAFGQFVKEELRASGVIDEYLVMDQRVHTSVVFISRTTATPEFEALRAGDHLLEPGEVRPEAVARAKVVHASTFALSRSPCREAVALAFDMAADHGKLISLDPNYSPVVWPQRDEARNVIASMLARATLAKPSMDDSERFFGDRADPETYAARWHELGPPVVVLTMGSEGVLLSHEGATAHIPARPVAGGDATAAGDAFWAGFLVALLDGNPLERCARFANAVAARKLATVGHIPGPVDRDEVYASLDG